MRRAHLVAVAGPELRVAEEVHLRIAVVVTLAVVEAAEGTSRGWANEMERALALQTEEGHPEKEALR